MRPEGVLLSITDNDMKLKGWRGYVIGTKGCTVRAEGVPWSCMKSGIQEVVK